MPLDRGQAAQGVGGRAALVIDRDLLRLPGPSLASIAGKEDLRLAIERVELGLPDIQARPVVGLIAVFVVVVPYLEGVAGAFHAIGGGPTAQQAPGIVEQS